MIRIASMFILATILFLAQGVSASESVPRASVVDHVTYLASPKLKGRKSMSRGSKKARTYIADHFEKLGLVPWGGEENYFQPVVIGTNVVAVLPGGDPALKDEIVLVTAHYDHLDKKHPGAADNAAGVAALLEIASGLASAPERPKRTVAFAAFDCEERGLWGSVCFSVREDFDPEAIVVNINMDILGRKGFDILENTLFMATSHALPSVDRAVAEAPGIRVLPVPRYLAAMRSDHAVFGALDIPTLFFSSGLYPDYHQEEDTLERLDLTLLADSAATIEVAVTAAANSPDLDAAPYELAGTDTMLASVATVLDAVVTHPDTFSLPTEKSEEFGALLADLRAHVGGPQCDGTAHADLVVRSIHTLVPIAVNYEQDVTADERSEKAEEKFYKKMKPEDIAISQAWGRIMFFLPVFHDAPFIENYREVATKVVSRSRAGLVLRGLPTHEYSSVPLQAEEYAMVRDGDGHVTLDVLFPIIQTRIQPQMLLRFLPAIMISMGNDLYHVEGTQDEVVDNLLLRWTLLEDREGEDNVPPLAPVYGRFLEELTGERIEAGLDAWLDWRMAQLGLNTREEWQWHVGQSDTYHLQALTLRDPFLYHKDLLASADRVASDPGAPAGLRANALNYYINIDTDNGNFTATPAMLKVLIGFIDDETEIENAWKALVNDLDWDKLPIVGPVMRKYYRQLVEAENAKEGDAPTLGSFAYERLQALTGDTELPQERAAWEAWLAGALASDPEGGFVRKVNTLDMPWSGAMELKRDKGELVFTVGRRKMALPEKTQPIPATSSTGSSVAGLPAARRS